MELLRYVLLAGEEISGTLVNCYLKECGKPTLLRSQKIFMEVPEDFMEKYQ